MSDKSRSVPVIAEPPVYPVGKSDPGEADPIAQRVREVQEALAQGKTFDRQVDDGSIEDDYEDEPEEGLAVAAADPQEIMDQADDDVDASDDRGPDEPIDEPEIETPGEDQLDEEAEEEADPEAEGEEPAQEQGDEESDVFVAKLPGRGPDDPDLEIELDGLEPEEREAFARLRNGYMRREQLRVEREAFEEKESVVNETLIALQTDPLNFVMEELKGEMKVDLARHLLSDADTYKAVRDDLVEWDTDDRAREAAQARLALARRDAADSAIQRRQAYRQAQETTRMVGTVLDAIIPEGLTDDEAQGFHDAAIYDLQRHVSTKKTNTLTKEDVLHVLDRSGALRRYGISPDDAGRKVAALDATPSSSPRRVRAQKRQPSAASKEEKARNTGNDFKRRSARRKNAASSAPAGVGSSAATMRPPKGQGVKDRAEWFLRNRT